MDLSATEKEEKEYDYVSDEVVERTIPVINDKTKIINPYIDADVTVGKNYYDYKETEDKQINSILVHDNTYMQNTGIDYIKKEQFEIVSILDGTVTNVKEDENIGKIVEIKHNNGIVSMYESLSEVKVKKGDTINQGQVIGISGENEIEKELGNHLHFEIYENGQTVNPENYLNKEVTIKEAN